MIHIKDYDRDIFIICPYKKYEHEIKSLLSSLSNEYPIKCVLKNDKMCLYIYDTKNLLKAKLEKIIGCSFQEYNSEELGLQRVKISPEKKLYYIDNNKKTNSSNVVLSSAFSYSGMKPDIVFKKYGIVALGVLWDEKQHVDKEKFKRTIAAIEDGACEWIQNESKIDPEDVEMEDVKEFLINAFKIMPDVKIYILNKSSYVSVDSFLQADEIVLRSAYATTRKKLLNMLTKK